MLWAAALLPVLTLYACGRPHNDYAPDASSESIADSSYARSSDVSMHAGNIPEKRVKTADLRLQVDNVVQSAVRMEQLVTRAGGIVEESEIRQIAGRQEDARYTSDSLRRVTWYAPEATLRLRVPVKMMDSVVYALTGMAAFVEHRTLKDTDMTLKHLHNKLLNDVAKDETRPVQHTKENKELDVRQYQEDAQRGAVGRTIENLGIDQLASFSTLTVSLRQPQLASITIIPDPERLSRSYFWTDVLLSIRGGLEGFRAVLLFFLRIWPLLLTAAFTWYAYRKWFPRLKASASGKPQS